jgi:lipid-A-disaccharide synthase
VAPQTWAWAPWRSRRLARAADRLLVTFPFEPAVFRDAGVAATYVGHPLFEAPLPPPRTPEALPSGPLVELRPGSRRRDVRRQGPIVLDAAARLAERLPAARFLVRLASPRAAAEWQRIVEFRARHETQLFETGEGDDRQIAAAITTSGTSTAELAAALVPMVVFYRVSLLGRLGKALLVTSPFIAMANLLAGREVVPERLVSRRGGRALGDELVALLADPARWRAMRDTLVPVRDRLAHPGVADRVARAILAR